MAERADPPPVSERFAANLRRFRQAAGISQEELAFAAEIHRTQVSFIEGGHRMPRLDTLVKLAGALGVTANDLVDGVDLAALGTPTRSVQGRPPRRRRWIATAAAVGRALRRDLRRVRRRTGLSQEQLAGRAGLHRTEVGLLERSGRTCRIDTLIRLAGAMAVRPEELLAGIVWVPAPETEGTFTFNSSPFRHRSRTTGS